MCCLGHSLDSILSVGEDKLCRFICDDASGIVTNVIYGISIIFMNGIVLTANHVIEGSEALKVNAGGQEYDAEVVGTYASSDLAVIKLKDASGLTSSALTPS